MAAMATIPDRSVGVTCLRARRTVDVTQSLLAVPQLGSKGQSPSNRCIASCCGCCGLPGWRRGRGFSVRQPPPKTGAFARAQLAGASVRVLAVLAVLGYRLWGIHVVSVGPADV